MPEISQTSGFAAFDIPQHLQSTLNRMGFTTPTPIQAQAIPIALTGRDLVGIAQTGTGKTLAFGLPMLANLQQGKVGLIIAPTRELALQIEDTLRKFQVRTVCLIGGMPMGRQLSQLRSRPQFIIATPGRLMDHMNQGTVKLDNVQIAVLDEADRMLDMGFAPAIRRILGATPNDRQTLLFSATMPGEIADLAEDYLRDPMRVELSRAGTTPDNVEQELYVVEKEGKSDLLQTILQKNNGAVLVFTRTRHGARKLASAVRFNGHSAAEIHSDRTLAQRRAALHGFKTGEYRVLVATDITSRGIDVKDIAMVVNYDIPENPEDYVHRIGRTGRAGASGRAVTFATPDQHRDVKDIERLLKTQLPVSKDSVLTLDRPQAPAQQHGGGRSRGRKPFQRFGRR
ncbi:MAG: DEAD/DEAH box helicase [Armatimonadetes bacterium]|nr:DEAD/DEAH box helicase [Armatimonadota bacterium]